jgi:hypothetical protein
MKYNRLKRLGLACGCYLSSLRDQFFVFELIFACLLSGLDQPAVGLVESVMHLEAGLYRLQLVHMHNKSDNHQQMDES